ncbi:MAG: acyl-ACP--UDP-N-acetylglucosamine O-acyltransferase [Nitrospirae bacterium]|nr:acyl-ACP--UDP-N-acetylglucosamine O-acyltransferase [Nitrospirota bacterium]
MSNENRGIHPTAIIAAGAQLGDGVEVGAYSIIGGGAKIGRGTKIHAHVVIDGNTTIGEDCEIFPFASIGMPPQDLKYHGEDTRTVIGNRNMIREYVSVHRASTGGDGETTIGHDNFLMAYCHVAHDCKIGSHIVMANAATLAGHSVVNDHAVIGGLVAVHQFTRIGEYAMIGGFSGVPQDVPPFTIASGDRAKLYGLNLVGLKRSGFSEEKIASIKKAFKDIFKSKLSMKDALEKVRAELGNDPEIAAMLDFLSVESKRGIMR